MDREHIKHVENVIDNYFEGIFFGDTEKLRSCFHENVILYGDINGSTYIKTLTEYLNSVRERQSPNDLKEPFKMETISIDIIGKIAMVKLHVPMLGYNYHDYLSMTKINDQWKIVNKIFTHVD